MRRALAVTLLLGCSGSIPDRGVDVATTDAGLDAARDAASEAVPRDVAQADRLADVSRDVTVDLPIDLPRDLPIDLPRDLPIDLPRDLIIDLPRDLIVDLPPDVTVDAPEVGAPACPVDTVALAGFCMDRYEAPNLAGARPLAMQTAVEGERWCAARGRRLCTEAEWVGACRGAAMRPYPYGTTYQRGRCADDRTWRSPNWTTLGAWPSAAAMAEATRLYQADPSGARVGCASQDGVFDMTGNVAEWVTRSFPNANNYAHVMKGCYWAGCYGGTPPSCAFVNPAHPGTFRSYEAGFRCCLTPR